MTPEAECLFTVVQKNANLKGGRVKDGPASRREDLKGGRQQQHTHAESGGLIKKVICAAGGEKNTLGGACLLNWIRS